jgi:hypothetical protein
MKEKTSITLSSDLIKALDKATGRGGNRSAYIEAVLRKHFRKLTKRDQDALEAEKLNRLAAKLNAEMAEVLEFQAPWPEGR